MSIEEAESEIIEEFSLYDDWMDKYEYLIGLGKDLPLIDEKDKLPENLVNGCQSRVWLKAKLENGVLNYYADSDALITKGLISLLVSVFSGHRPQEIIDADASFINKIGLSENLSQNRAVGLKAMIKQMKLYAVALQS